MKPKISIIIPTLNEENYLPGLLECLKKQTHKDFEIIVSDGKSTDNTANIAKKYGCILVTSRKRSPAHQRNAGAKKARYQILLFLDADTRFGRDFIQKSLVHFQGLGIAGYRVELDSDKLLYKVYSFLMNLIFTIGKYVKPSAIGAAILSRKKYHDKLGGFDETIHIGEDHDYAFRLSKISKYNLLPIKIRYSIRRFQKEGNLKLFFKWIYCTFYYIIFGKIKKKIVDYDFG